MFIASCASDIHIYKDGSRKLCSFRGNLGILSFNTLVGSTTTTQKRCPKWEYMLIRMGCILRFWWEALH